MDTHKLSGGCALGPRRHVAQPTTSPYNVPIMAWVEVLAYVPVATFLLFLIAGGIRGAPFVPTGSRTLKTMIDLANIQPDEKVADLGSGDGRIVIAIARVGAEAHGYEINPFLVLWSRYRINRAGLSRRAFVHWRDIWRVDFASFKVITVFGMVHIMGPLERKLRRELRPGSRVVSNTFKFPCWPLSSKEGRVYLYDQA